MAIYPKLYAPPATYQSTANPSNIESWAEQAAEALQNLSLSTQPVPRGTSGSLSIPLGVHATTETREKESALGADSEASTGPRPSSSYRRREPLRRDSLKRREALLKGKEGSRRRQRWENDRLLNNPWVQPPLPSDWEVRPTHPVHHVPYYLAPLWDTTMANGAAKNSQGQNKKAEDPSARVPKEVRQKLKRAKAAKGLLQDLEEEVRLFVKRWHEKERSKQRDGFGDIDSDEEEIVFVGRNGQMHDSPTRERFHLDVSKEKLVFDGLADDHGASFGRWLVHSIGTYYGLPTWSITVGDPARREAYVGINDRNKPLSGHAHGDTLPRPLWGMV